MTNTEKDDILDKRKEVKELQNNIKEKQNILEKSFVKKDNYLYEQINSEFFIRNDGKLCKSVEIDSSTVGKKIVYPCKGEELSEHTKTVYLPTSISNYNSVVDLVEEVKTFIHEWADLPEEFETFSAWYVLLTWIYDTVPTINYLSVMGDTGTGKSRFLFTVGLLCYKPIVGSGGVSVAAVKRLITKWGGTLLIDEGDLKVSNETAELIKLFNLGFEKNQSMFNCDKNDPKKIEFFNPYGPKIITRRRQFTDQALEARCLTNVMQQTTRKDIVPVLTKDFHKKQTELRNKLLKFRFDYYDKIDIDKSINLDLGKIEPRIKQATLAFTTLLANVPEALESFKTFIQQYNKQVIEERAESYDGQIVNAIINLINNNQKYITSQMIVDECQNSKITTRAVGRHLKQLGLETYIVRVEDKTPRVVPINNRLIEICKRYCTDKEKVSKVSKVSLLCNTDIKRNEQSIYINNKKIAVNETNETYETDETKKKHEIVEEW